MKLSSCQAQALKAVIEAYVASGEREVHAAACERLFNQNVHGYRWRSIRFATWSFLEAQGLVMIRRCQAPHAEIFITPTQSARAALPQKAG